MTRPRPLLLSMVQEKKPKRAIFFPIRFERNFIFQLLRKPERELGDDPPLRSVSPIHENMLMKVRLIQTSSESCDPWAEGSKGTRGWWGRAAALPQTKGAVPTCLHLLWERVALCIMETGIASNKRKHGNATLTLPLASEVWQPLPYGEIYKWAKYNLNKNLDIKTPAPPRYLIYKNCGEFYVALLG